MTMFQNYKYYRDGHIAVVKDRMDLVNENVGPTFRQCFRAELWRLNLKETDLASYLKEGNAEPASTRWILSKDFAERKNERLWLGIDYRRLIAETIRVRHNLASTKACI